MTSSELLENIRKLRSEILELNAAIDKLNISYKELSKELRNAYQRRNVVDRELQQLLLLVTPKDELYCTECNVHLDDHHESDDCVDFRLPFPKSSIPTPNCQ